MRRGWRRSLFLLLSFVAVDGQAQQPAGATAASEHFSIGSEAFARQDYQAALTAFVAAIEAGSDGPAVHYNVAVCHYRLGDYAAAAAAFRELAAAFPGMRDLADYNLGLALVRQDEGAAARVAFTRAAAAEDAQLAALARAMLARLDAASPAPPASLAPAGWQRYFDTGLGHDDNVALIDPLGLPAGQSTESPFIEMQFYAGGPVTRDWNLTANAFLLEYPDADDFDQIVIDLRARHTSTVAEWTLLAGPDFGRSYIGGEGFEQYVGMSVELRRYLAGPDATLALEFAYDRADELDAQFGYVDGNRKVFSVGLDKRLARVRVIVDYRFTRDDRAGAGVSANRSRYRATFRRPLGAAWTADLRIGYRQTEYDRVVPAREEQRYQAGLRASRELASGWRFSVSYRYSDNDASDPVFSYERHRWSAGVSRLF